MRTLLQAMVDAYGFRSPPKNDMERRQKAYAVAEFQRTTGFDADLLNMPVDVIAEAVAYYIGNGPNPQTTPGDTYRLEVERVINAAKVIAGRAVPYPQATPGDPA